FGTAYGWAGGPIGKKRPDFSDLEKDVGMSVARPEYQRATNVVHPGIRGFLDHQHDELGEGAGLPWEPHAASLGEPLALTAKTLTAFTGGLIDLSSAASDLVLTSTITHFRDKVVAAVYPSSERPGEPDDPA
ncbi:MAG TPA: hypothetical protein VF625_17250, partial [Longimicrobium sp.]